MTASDGNSSKRTTIYDIAEIVGTSPTAVTSVLNGSWKKRRISQKLADRVLKAAEEQGYAVNIQASVLRKDKSNIVGMVIPKYDNRFFGAIAEQFEEAARAAGLFPVITCTQRDPDLEVAAVRGLLSYQVDCLVACGATNPDRIAEVCAANGVPTINLDLPGSRAPSIISDSLMGAFNLTNVLLDACAQELGQAEPLVFIGGRLDDHNTQERRRGFVEAHSARGIDVPPEYILTPGYAPDKARHLLENLPFTPHGIFVNSTITLEGVVRLMQSLPDAEAASIRYGSFDYDPFGALLPQTVAMVEQDVPSLIAKLMAQMRDGAQTPQVTKVPCILHPR
ncbi:substrate-binding domain-containing protein [Tropicibacter naphthalenivorans]|uniref:Fructose repressor n=1 Tax=Tropicibacter naphthalenivorans TaxID=441103 RepID=A0A0P1GFS4_9RHOB|nr:LacI family DNA-binding transcriptional regulator [Tropicibacter naphthalenivorans]CUH80658.1 Fructose repressor [Tropicibacter naphthalenivorans]SMC89212.1 transcriptional regulator, LacI family [Tropicibacter naphthalenivorans]